MVIGRRKRVSPVRWVAAAAVLVLVFLGFYLVTQQEQTPTVRVVVTSEPWLAGTRKGFEVVEVPAELATRFAVPAAIVNNVTSVDLPQGSMVPLGVLSEESEGLADQGATLMNFPVRTELWPGDGPRAGDTTAFSPTLSTCALFIAELVAVNGPIVTLEVTPDLMETLISAHYNPMFVWEVPPAGWPLCPPDEPADE